MDPSALFQISYGLYVLSAREAGQDNGCIINTVNQVTDTPARVCVAVSKSNLTHDMVLRSGTFNVSVLDETAPFSLFQRFGYRSGREADKFAGLDTVRTPGGLLRPAGHVCAFLEGQVFHTVDLGTHTLFLADVTAAERCPAQPPVTYRFYQERIKPKPRDTDRKGWRCKICGYVYEGDPLPPDFICPICKHGAADFEPVG